MCSENLQRAPYMEGHVQTAGSGPSGWVTVSPIDQTDSGAAAQGLRRVVTRTTATRK